MAMPFRTKLTKAETQLAASLRASPGRIYARAELAEHFYKARRQGVLAKHTKFDEFIEFLVMRRHLLAFAELEANVNLNRPATDNVRLLNVCIAPKSGEVAFGSRGQGGDSTSSLLFGKKKTHWTVKALTFDGFIRQNNVAECNFRKMDIEGGESSILPTMVEYLKAIRPTLHLSLHPCYLKIRPLGSIGRIIARLAGTWKIIRCIEFYKHLYDPNGRELTPWRLLWLCRAKITMDIVLTDLEWSVAT